MCRALKVMCAAASADRLGELRSASVSAVWELVEGVASASASDVAGRVAEWQPDVLVVDSSVGPAAAAVVAAARTSKPTLRVVVVGPSVEGADACVETLDAVRDAILGEPKPGGPVRG